MASRLLRRLLPRSDAHLLLSRDAAAPIPPFDVAGVRTLPVDRPSDALASFATAQGFPAGWTTDMLADGAAALLALDEPTGAALAMAWTTTRPFYVDELQATFDPRGGAYLFGDFVAPASRGRGLQRLLVARRLELAGATPAHTIVHPTNVASLRSYERAGFVATARFTRYHWRRRTWARCTRVAGGPAGFEMDGRDRIRVVA